jgi:hypothetical protein
LAPHVERAGGGARRRAGRPAGGGGGGGGGGSDSGWRVWFNMDVDFATNLAFALHYLPVDVPAKARRLRSRAWLENASLFSGGTALLHFCCRWSPLFAAVRVVLARPGAALRVEAGEGTLEPEGLAALQSICARSLLARADSLLPALCRAVELGATAVWPEVAGPPLELRGAALRARVEASLVSSVGALAERAGGGGTRAVLDGLGAALSLLVSALHNKRAPLVCRPLPPWLMEGFSDGPSSRGDGGGGVAEVMGAYEGGPHAQLLRADTDALDAAVGGLPSVAALAAGWPAMVGSLPPNALLLLYWLAVLAPVRLVRAPAPRLAGAAATFDVVHGPPPVVLGEGAAVPLWDAHAAATCPPLRAVGPRCFHGTATDNAFSALNFGLRPLSGTRHESSGSIFGAGVYLSCSPGVARGFADRKGAAWRGYRPEPELQGEEPPPQRPGAWRDVEPHRGAHVVPTTLRPVLEVDLLRAPQVRFVEGGKDVALPLDASPPLGAYIVVPEANKLWALALHLFADSAGGADAVSARLPALPADDGGRAGRTDDGDMYNRRLRAVRALLRKRVSHWTRTSGGSSPQSADAAVVADAVFDAISADTAARRGAVAAARADLNLPRLSDEVADHLLHLLEFTPDGPELDDVYTIALSDNPHAYLPKLSEKSGARARHFARAPATFLAKFRQAGMGSAAAVAASVAEPAARGVKGGSGGGDGGGPWAPEPCACPLLVVFVFVVFAAYAALRLTPVHALLFPRPAVPSMGPDF